MNIEDVTTGESWGCYFTAVDLLQDGKPVQEGESTDTAKPGVFESFGIIKTRDLENKLLEVIDSQSQKVYVVSWEDVRDVDRIEWHAED